MVAADALLLHQGRDFLGEHLCVRKPWCPLNNIVARAVSLYDFTN